VGAGLVGLFQAEMLRGRAPLLGGTSTSYSKKTMLLDENRELCQEKHLPSDETRPRPQGSDSYAMRPENGISGGECQRVEATQEGEEVEEAVPGGRLNWER